MDAFHAHAPEGARDRSDGSGWREYADLGLAHEGNLSFDDARVALVARRRADGALHAILWSLEHDELVARVALDHPRVDYATVSPRGDLLVVNGELEPGLADRTRVLDLDGEPVGADWEPYGTPSHFDLALGPHGEQLAVGVAKTAHDAVLAGSVISRDLADGAIRTLLEARPARGG